MRLFKRTIRRGLEALRSWLYDRPTRAEGPEKAYEGYPWNSAFELMTGDPPRTRPNYAWGVLQGVKLAKALGYDRVSVIEFGVAGGNGLISLETVAERAEVMFGVGVDVFGFDTGTGLTKPQDYRDLPNLYAEQDFAMDVPRLQERLKKATLVLGPVEETIPHFMESKPSPVAFVSIDLDLYSSTLQALRFLDADQELLLPRIHCYFDDIMNLTFCEFTGERLAISEFNQSHQMRKISQIYGLRYVLPDRYSSHAWTEQFYMAHIFDHELYAANDNVVAWEARVALRT